MSYLSDFERSFCQRTLQLVKSYAGPYDATLLVNCLLGLLIVPKESFIEAVPESPLSELSKWGISESSILDIGRASQTNPKPDTLRGLVINLRHSVAHFRIRPEPEIGEVHSFRYTNDKGLVAVIPLTEMRRFVERLSSHLSTQ